MFFQVGADIVVCGGFIVVLICWLGTVSAGEGGGVLLGRWRFHGALVRPFQDLEGLFVSCGSIGASCFAVLT